MTLLALDLQPKLTQMETGVTDIPSVKVNPTGLLLRWDEREVQWAWVVKNSSDSESGNAFSFGSRKVNNISMLPEVVRALKGRYKSVNQVVYSKRFAPSTIVPAIVIDNDANAAVKWFKFHHASAGDVVTRVSHLDSVDGEPVFVEGIDEVWDKAVLGAFPQAMAVIQSAALMDIAVGISRQNTEFWVVVVDAGENGADLVAASGGKGVWNSVAAGGDVDGVLYSVVNAMHRADIKPENVMVMLSGEGLDGLEKTFKRFFNTVENLGQTPMEGLKILA